MRFENEWRDRFARGAEAGVQATGATFAPNAASWGALLTRNRGMIYTLVVFSIVSGLNNVDRAMLGLLLPKLQQEMALSDLTLGFLTGPAFMIVYSVAGLPIAWLADRWSRRNIVAIGLTFWSATIAATGLAMNAIHLTITRILLGLGEASSVAPISSIVGDLLPQRNRSIAFAVLGAGTPVGIMVFFPLIGSLAEAHGWRSAFFVMGAIGILIAALLVLTVKEPRRGAFEDAPSPPSENKAFGASVRILLRSRGYMFVLYAGVFVALSYGVMVAWLPTYMERIYGLNAKETGAYLGLYRGLFGIAGPFFGGGLAAYLARRDIRFSAWVPAGLCFAMVPAECLLLLSDSGIWWQIGLALDTFLVLGLMPTTFALLLLYINVNMRATGIALSIMVGNLIGQGAGPLIVGALSEAFAPEFGREAIRYAMLVSPLAVLGAGILFLSSARAQGIAGPAK